MAATMARTVIITNRAIHTMSVNTCPGAALVGCLIETTWSHACSPLDNCLVDSVWPLNDRYLFMHFVVRDVLVEFGHV
jgi:hypothetical protein